MKRITFKSKEEKKKYDAQFKISGTETKDPKHKQKKKKREKTKGEAEMEFPYGDCVIMKANSGTPLSDILARNLEELTEKKAKNRPQVLINDIIEKLLKTITSTPENEAREIKKKNLKLYFESSLNPSKNAQKLYDVIVTDPQDPYSVELAEAKYLSTPPVSFLILGKPSPDNYKLARKIADRWGCICIDPITCMEDEMANVNSPSYEWCKKLLCEGKYIPSEIAMSVMERRALDDEILHKGFVLCGLPFPPLDDEPSIQEQLHMIFNWPVKPTLLIYITYPDDDAITKALELLYDYNTGISIHKNVFSMEQQYNLVYSLIHRVPTVTSFKDDIVREMEKEKNQIGLNDVKHLVSIPQTNLKCDILRYRQVALPALERYVSHFDPQSVIRVDGRTTSSHMLRIILAKADAMGLQQVINPVPLMAKLIEEEKEEKKEKSQTVLAGEGEEAEPEEEVEIVIAFENLDEAHQYFAHKDTIRERFSWCKSDWGYLCPVELYHGKAVEGDFHYAARFLDKIYYLSSKDALSEFMKNPRKYLMPPNPKPPCKFVIMGHTYSGKSDVSLYLHHVYKGKIINFQEDIEKKQKEGLKEDEFRKKIVHKVLKQINRERYERYAEVERIRKENIRNWHLQQMEDLSQVPIPDYDETFEEPEDMFLTEVDTPPFYLEEPLILQLSIARCRWLLRFPEDLLVYLPPDLALPTPLPQAAREDEPDIIDAIEDALQKAREKNQVQTPEEKMCSILVDEIRKAEDEFKLKTGIENLTGGWVVDGMPPNLSMWECLMKEDLFPEAIISLQDQSLEYNHLRSKWREYKAASVHITDSQYGGLSEYEEGYETAPESPYLSDYGEVTYSRQAGEVADLDEFLRSLQNYDEEWKKFVETITPAHPPICINIANKPIEDIKKDVSRKIEVVYTSPAIPFSENNTPQDEEEENEEEERGEDDQPKEKQEGDSGPYCPVAYKLHNVLWKGKNNLMSSYKCKIYTTSSEEALEKFKENPWDYAPFHEPQKYTQPLRICIVGPVGSGKTTVGRLLGRSLGLFHSDFPVDINYILIPQEEPIGRRNAYIPLKVRSKEDEEIEALCGEDGGNLESREAVSQYLKDGKPIPTSLVSHVLDPLWHKEPYKSTGFVLSDFPLHPEDFDILKEHHLVPDLIICMNVNREDRVKERLINELKAHRENEARLQKKKIEKAQMAKNLRQDVMRSSNMLYGIGDEEYGELSEDAMEANIDLPQVPNVTKEPNTPDDASGTEYATTVTDELSENTKEQYEDDIDEWYAADLEKLVTIKTLAVEEKIQWLDISTENEATDVCLQIIHEIQYMINRRTISSPFENAYQVSHQEAENLLESGYCFLSRFGRWCPVQLEEGKIPIQRYIPLKQKEDVFPVVHRKFIYFLGGNKNMELFMKNPLKYIHEIKVLPAVPIKMAIIGPPKCGKTTLANRLAKHTNAKVITIGASARYVLEDLSWTQLANEIDKILREGEVLPVDLALRCVEAATMDAKSTAQGYILDGIPATPDQIYEMCCLNLIPYLVISLDCSLNVCHTRMESKDTTQFFSRVPVFPLRLLKHKYRHWLPASYKTTKILKSEYSNVVDIEASHTLWWMYKKSLENLYDVMKCISQYYLDITSGKPGKLACMCISCDEFSERQSQLKSYCPGCLKHEILKSGGMPPSKTGLVHFMNFYYWLCKEHIDEFLRKPDCFLPPKNPNPLPEALPQFTEGSNCDAEITNEGYCIVCYTDSTPQREYVKGLPEYSVVYDGKRYMFCDQKHLEKFMRTPKYYSSQDMCMLPLKLGELPVMKLPTLGFLEQTTANLIHSALLNVATERPKYPGLPLDVSGAILMGYYLKSKNAKMGSNQLDLLRMSQEMFLYRCKILKKLTQKCKIRNPLLSHPAGGEPDAFAKGTPIGVSNT